MSLHGVGTVFVVSSQGTVELFKRRLPVAVHDGEVVRDVVEDVSCAACGEDVEAVDGMYQHIEGACHGGHENLHRVAVSALAASITESSVFGVPFEATWRCAECLGWSKFEVAVGGETLRVEQHLEKGLIPDIAVMNADGSVRCVVEVVVTNDVSPAKAKKYRALGIPLIRVWPSWEGLSDLFSGFEKKTHGKPPLSIFAENREGHRTHGFTVENAECNAVRHPLGEKLPQCACGAHTIEVALEVTGTGCYRCGKYVPVLDVLLLDEDVTRSPEDLYSESILLCPPSSPDLPPGVERIAKEMGVTLERRHSKTAETGYLMHACPSCGAGIGNFYLGTAMDGPREVSLDTPRRVYGVCEMGHWNKVIETPWNAPEDREAMYDECLDNPECFDEYGPCGRCPRVARFEGGYFLDWG